MATLNYKCPKCGGPLQFNPEKQMFSCEYCFSDFTEQEVQQRYSEREQQTTKDERDVEYAAKQKAEAEKQGFEGDDYPVSYSCPSCGAEIITTASTAATHCVYCQNPVVLGGRLSGEFKPDTVIPFAVDKKKATDVFLNMCKKKWFLPKGFTSSKQFEKMQGVYFPYWYVDEQMRSSVTATGQTERTWTSGNRRYTETSTYRLYRTGDILIQNVAENALKITEENSVKADIKVSQKTKQEMLSCVHPFDLSKQRPFAMSYLSGFQAEKRDIEKQDLTDVIARRMDEYATTLLKNTMNSYSGISIENYNDETFKQDWRYTLLPVWIVTYKFNGQLLPFAINGQTGKTYGKLPIAIGKVIGIAAVIAVIIFALATLGGMLFL